MHRGIVSLSLPLLLLVGKAAFGDCAYPPPPGKVPDGSTATKEELLSAKEAYKQYDASINAFLSCLDMETAKLIETAGAEAPADKIAEIQARQAKRHNAAIDELETHASELNDQVRAFNGKKKKS